MPSPFTKPPSSAHFKPGMLFLGVDDDGQEIGIATERHAITFAGAGSGKGAALIIPNLKRWPHNALTVDPKGENLEQTWADREAMGQTVAALDPFAVANVPDRLRVSCNLLAHIDPNGLTAREDIRVIADGMVIRFKAEDGTWDNGAVSVIAGCIDFVLNTAPPEERDLTAVRRLLTLPPDALKEMFEEMAATPTRTGLARRAASIGLSDSKKNRDFVSGAGEHTEWLDSPAMAGILTGNGGFDLSTLKHGAVSLYLVIPPKYLAEHGRFLRLFVRAALDAMSQNRKGKKCLFLLDEFFSLGHIDQISKAAGLMRGYGVQLWPFLQDIGQLRSLYGAELSQTFFGNADAQIFFGSTDSATLDAVSMAIGHNTEKDLVKYPLPPRRKVSRHDSTASKMMEWDFYIEDIRSYRQAEDVLNNRLVGKPRIGADDIRELVAKKDGDIVARSMIVFAKGGDIFNLRLAPHFEPTPPPLTTGRDMQSTKEKRRGLGRPPHIGDVVWPCAAVAFTFMPVPAIAEHYLTQETPQAVSVAVFLVTRAAMLLSVLMAAKHLWLTVIELAAREKAQKEYEREMYYD